MTFSWYVNDIKYLNRKSQNKYSTFAAFLLSLYIINEQTLNERFEEVLFLFFFVCLCRAALAAYGCSQARGPVRAVAASLSQGHSNVGSKLHL